MPLAKVNGVTLYYELRGQGPSLVLVHEFAGCYKSWQPQIDVLSAHYRILVYNCRGYPPSTVPSDLADYSQELSIEDLRQLLDHLGIERTALGGFSMGGSIALNFALTFPDRVRALILAGTGTGSADKQQFTREFSPIADRLEREGVQRVAEDYLRGPTRIQLFRKDPVMWRKFHADFVELSSLGLANTLRGVQLRRPTMYELEAGLRTLRVPTLVIVGDEDAPAIDASRFVAGTIPGARVLVLPGTGHTLNLEAPAAFNAAMLQFLREVED
jgi:pimeloyl-ACP methyl ester carboxylesterase